MDYYCQRCGRIIGEAERVCPACGVSQDRFKADEEQKACKKCQQEIPVNSNYCYHCGADQAQYYYQSEPLKKETPQVEKEEQPDQDNIFKQIFEGDYDIRVPVKGEDEISSLSRNFNRMAKKIKESIWEIEEYSRKQQRFTDNFAHELKTPLTSMIGYADMLRSKKLTEEQTVVYADRIVREGKRLEAMSMKLMQLIVLKKQDFRLRKISAATFFEQVKETVLPVLNNEGITFRINAEEALIFIEPDLMKTVLVNLVDNARKAVADQGLIEIRGSLKGNVYQICVRDNGCGMEESEVENAAEAFYMADKSRSRKKGGAGLGLSICREIVDVHKGRMIIKSRPQMGTAVTVLIGGEKIEA